MGTTPNYNFNVPVGSDIVNPLTQSNPNWEALDTILKTISNTGVGTATELKTGTVHSLTRSDTDRKVFTFVATTNFVAGETFLLDGEQVTALTASGEQLSTGCYVIGSNVLVSVHDTLLTFYVPESTAKDAQRLGGELPSHYATESDLEEIQGDMTAVEAKLGTGVFQTQAQNAVDAVNELNTQLSHVGDVAVCGLTSSTWNPGMITTTATLVPGVYSMTFPLPASAGSANYLVSIYDVTHDKRLAYEYNNMANKPYGCLALNIEIDSTTVVGIRLDSSASVSVTPSSTYSNLVIIRVR